MENQARRRKCFARLVDATLTLVACGMMSTVSATAESRERDTSTSKGAIQDRASIATHGSLSLVVAQRPAVPSPVVPGPAQGSSNAPPADETQPAAKDAVAPGRPVAPGRDAPVTDAPVTDAPVTDPVTDPLQVAPVPAADVPVAPRANVPVAPPTALGGSRFRSRRSSLGVTAGSFSAAPNMMGDHFGGLNRAVTIQGATVALGGGDRRFKLAENVSPVPQDRLFYNFNHFHHALTDVNGNTQSLSRSTFGIEKTFLHRMASVELRLPVVDGLDATQRIGSTDTRGVEFGDIALALKMNLLSNRNWILSGGVAVTFPTGDEFDLLTVADVSNVNVKSEAFHVSPFLGYLHQDDSCWFWQGFLQADFDVNGNNVIRFESEPAGKIDDQTLLFVDASLGRWLYRRRHPCRRTQGVAVLAELHYTTTLNDSDFVGGVTNPFNRMDILNATGALAFSFEKSTLRAGFAVPLSSGEERLFDSEWIFQFNRFF